MISCVILTKNEEKNIEECLGSVAWCDEIIIVDDESEDKTIGVIRGIGEIGGKTKVFSRKLNGDFAGQRNFGMEKASGEWVLFVDSDERISEELKDEILKHIRQVQCKQVQNDPSASSGPSAFSLRRRDFLFGKWLRFGESGKIRLIRLVKKGAGEWKRAVHEKWETDRQIGELKNPLLHYPHQTIDEFLKEINFYTDLNAKYLYEKISHKRGGLSWLNIIFYPLAKFIKNYFLLLGFLDGVPGFLHATFMSFHSFLTRAKLWQIETDSETSSE